MGNESLAERLEKAKSRHPLTEEERKRAFEALNDIPLRIDTNKVRINIVSRLMKEDDISLEGVVSKKDYEQIDKEFDKIYDLLNIDILKRIRASIEIERANNPDNYLKIVEEKMIKRELNIRKFFTFNRYLDRRRNNLDKDYLEFIKDMALKNEAYEFLESIKGD
jgi:hypothetical protein